MTSRLDQSTPMCIYPSIYKKNQANRTFTSSLGFNQNLLLPKPFQIWNLHRLREDPRLLVDDVKSTFPGGRHHQQECCESYQEGVDPGSSSQLACSRKISLNASKGSPLGKQSTCVYPQKYAVDGVSSIYSVCRLLRSKFLGGNEQQGVLTFLDPSYSRIPLSFLTAHQWRGGWKYTNAMETTVAGMCYEGEIQVANCIFIYVHTEI